MQQNKNGYLPKQPFLPHCVLCFSVLVLTNFYSLRAKIILIPKKSKDFRNLSAEREEKKGRAAARPSYFDNAGGV